MASELEVGKAKLGTVASQGNALLGARANGDSINFGHANPNGYGSNIGCSNNNGHPYVAFSAESGTNDNTFKTRGLLGNVIQATATGELKFSQVTNANADNQTATDRLTIASTGRVDTVAENNGDWSFKSQNTHASGFGALIIAGGSTASQTAFEVRHTGNTGSGTSAFKIDGTGGIQIGADGTARELRWGNTFANNGPTIIGHDVNGTLQFYPAGNGSGEAMKLASNKLATFSNGITVKGANNWSHISSQDGQSLTLADDAQIQLADTEAGSMLMHIYDRGTGYGALVFAAHGGQPILLADPSGVFAVADTDNKYCVYKSSGSHDVYFKNRSGGSKNFCILVTAGVLDDF